jgi:hypothetical protein
VRTEPNRSPEGARTRRVRCLASSQTHPMNMPWRGKEKKRGAGRTARRLGRSRSQNITSFPGAHCSHNPNGGRARASQGPWRWSCCRRRPIPCSRHRGGSEAPALSKHGLPHGRPQRKSPRPPHDNGLERSETPAWRTIASRHHPSCTWSRPQK